MPVFFSWDNVIYFLPRVLSALPVTLMIVAVATLSGLVLGLLLAFPRLEHIPCLRQLCAVIVSFIRGTPILIQMFIVYYGLPMLLMRAGINITRWDKIYFIYITYGINTGAYFSEIIRSSILSVPRAQRDAAAAAGLTRVQTYYRIIIPQSVVVAIPSLGTSMTSLLQDTSLAFAVGVMDIVGKIASMSSSVGHSLEGYLVASIIFIVLSFGIERSFAVLEKKTRTQNEAV
jgi:L-cystine transport system permease protein